MPDNCKSWQITNAIHILAVHTAQLFCLWTQVKPNLPLDSCSKVKVGIAKAHVHVWCFKIWSAQYTGLVAQNQVRFFLYLLRSFGTISELWHVVQIGVFYKNQH